MRVRKRATIRIAALITIIRDELTKILPAKYRICIRRQRIIPANIGEKEIVKRVKPGILHCYLSPSACHVSNI
ncbi:hypothetical protein PUN28_008853 [Cardiocondyla obscurior]|uniref:Uncharacterized protein n=1 Tax=Cardiocondyla obscurior TaxID=286306 RepID=A0AAW2FQR0_9HYME